MRGTLDDHHVNIEHGGIIPAHAGNTWLGGLAHICLWDHPRACGEHGLAA